MQRRSKHAFPTIERLCFLRGLCKVVMRKSSEAGKRIIVVESSRVFRRQPTRIWAWERRNWTESSLRNWQLQSNGKRGIGLWKENFICDLKWQWDCYKSVARIRLVKTENPSACVTVNWKVCSIAIVLHCPYPVYNSRIPLHVKICCYIY
jgi:hypothetical protein